MQARILRDLQSECMICYPHIYMMDMRYPCGPPIYSTTGSVLTCSCVERADHRCRHVRCNGVQLKRKKRYYAHECDSSPDDPPVQIPNEQPQRRSPTTQCGFARRSPSLGKRILQKSDKSSFRITGSWGERFLESVCEMYS
jgi:hypothetical protein